MKTQAKKQTAEICASHYGIFNVQPHPGSATPAGTLYAVLWNGGILEARCTCSANNFCQPGEKHCKHIDWLDERGCFWAGGPVQQPTHATRIRNKRGGVKDPMGFGFSLDASVSARPTMASGMCPNCEGPTVIVPKKRTRVR